jgi:hypothetical protein
MRTDVAVCRNKSLEQAEQRQGVQPIGNVLGELLARYRIRFPNLNVMVASPQRPSETGRR